MRQGTETIRGLLLNDFLRVAGNSERDGKPFSWTDGYVVLILPFDSKKGEPLKYTVTPELADSIALQLATVNWASVVTVKIADRKIVDLTVDLDWQDALNFN